MKPPRPGIGVIILALAASAALAADPEPVKREAIFKGDYVRAQKGMQAPKILKSAPPKFPPAFRDARISGVAVVEFIINADGEPEEVQYSSASDKAFGEAACAAVKKFRYEPGMVDGKPVRLRTIQRMDFNVDPRRPSNRLGTGTSR
jgi:TonB family protein